MSAAAKLIRNVLVVVRSFRTRWKAKQTNVLPVRITTARRPRQNVSTTRPTPLDFIEMSSAPVLELFVAEDDILASDVLMAAGRLGDERRLVGLCFWRWRRRATFALEAVTASAAGLFTDRAPVRDAEASGAKLSATLSHLAIAYGNIERGPSECYCDDVAGNALRCKLTPLRTVEEGRENADGGMGVGGWNVKNDMRLSDVSVYRVRHGLPSGVRQYWFQFLSAFPSLSVPPACRMTCCVLFALCSRLLFTHVFDRSSLISCERSSHANPSRTIVEFSPTAGAQGPLGRVWGWASHDWKLTNGRVWNNGTNFPSIDVVLFWTKGGHRGGLLITERFPIEFLSCLQRLIVREVSSGRV